MALKLADFNPCLNVPQPNGAIPAGAPTHLAVGRERNTRYPICMALKHLQELPCLAIPESDSLIAATGENKPSIGRNRYSDNAVRVPAQSQKFFPGGELDHLRCILRFFGLSR